MSVSLYFFPFSTYFTDLHNGCTYTGRSVFSFTSLPPLCKVSIFKSGSPCQDFKSCMYFLLQNNSHTNWNQTIEHIWFVDLRRLQEMGFGSFVTRCWVGVNNVSGGGVRIPLGRGLCWGEQLLRHSHHCLSPQMSGGPCNT